MTNQGVILHTCTSSAQRFQMGWRRTPIQRWNLFFYAWRQDDKLFYKLLNV